MSLKPQSNDFGDLHQALRNGDEERALKLIVAGSNAIKKDSMGETPLHCAARKGLPRACETIMDRGAKPDVACMHGFAPLHFAAECAQPDVCALLIERGATVDLAYMTRARPGNTPLQQMCTHPSSGSLAVLLAHGADVHRQNKDGYTALHLAALHGHTSACVELLQAGADPMTKAKGCTAAGLASRHKNKETASQIKAWMASNKARQALDAIQAVAGMGQRP
jgi:ankyrin repeat protein